MNDLTGQGRVLRFATFEVDLRSGELRKQGRKVPLQEQPFQILVELLEHSGEVVTREELRQKLWPPDVFVDFDQGLNNAIKKLRLALGDDAESPRFVETVARRGYRLLVPVERALAPEPSSVPASGRRRGVALAIATILLPLAYVVGLQLWPREGVADRQLRLLVLPLENLSGDPSQQYFSDGLTDELIAQLGLLHPQRLGVIARTTAEHYRGTKKSVREIGGELEADYILEGSVRRSSGEVRVSVALIRTRDEVQLWSAAYDRELKDVLGLQTEVASSVAGGLPIELSSVERARLASARPVDPQAYEAYLEGLFFWKKYKEDAAARAVQLFEKAIARDPGYAPAHAGLASAYSLLAVIGSAAPRDVFPKAKAAAAKALSIDPNQVDAHAALGWTSFIYDWDFPAAEREFTRAIALDRNSAEAYHGYGMYLAAMGRSESSLTAIGRARELDPLSLHINHKLCLVLYWSRQYEAAIAQCRHTLELEPRFAFSHFYLGHLHDAKGMHDEAEEEYLLANEYLDGDVEELRRTRAAVKASGWRPVVRQGVEDWSRALESSNDSRQAEEVGYFLAWSWMRVGDKERALEWLEKAYAARPFFLAFLGVEPLFDPLRSDPRFQELLGRIGLPQAGPHRPRS